MPDGNYRLGTLEVTVAGGVSHARAMASSPAAPSRSIAPCAIWSLWACRSRRAAMLTANPARLLGLEAHKGLLAPGADADLVLSRRANEVAA